jgi:hypothetical protein
VPNLGQMKGLGLCCLTPLSPIFQLDRGGQFYFIGSYKSNYHGFTTAPNMGSRRLLKVNNKTYVEQNNINID